MPALRPAPHVVILGGFLTEPVLYRPMRARLLRRGAAGVTIAPLHLPDWLAMIFAGMGPSLLRGGRAIREARRVSARPLLVVGHSAGGLVARLAMAPRPFEGRCVGVADDVGCLVTLGTPHRLDPRFPFWYHAGARAADWLERALPGAFFAPSTAYLSVGSTLVPPSRPAPTNLLKRAVGTVMRAVVGETPGVSGDGIVGDDRARLAGARHISLPDVLHGTFGGPWYGDDEVIERWWPVALELWREALAAREEPAAREESAARGESVVRSESADIVRPEAGWSPAALPARPRRSHPG